MDSNHQNKEKKQVVVVVVPFGAQGHLNPLLHLSRLIVSNTTTIPIHVHYVTTPIPNHQAKLRVQGWNPNSISNLHFHQVEDIYPNPNWNPYFETISSHLRDAVASLLQSLSSVTKRVIVIYDTLMAFVVQDAVNIPNVEHYNFHVTCAFTVFSLLYEAIGKPPLEKSLIFPQLPPLEFDFNTEQKETLKLSDGCIYNTTRVIESPYLDLLERFSDGKKQWALGPFNPLTIEKKDSKVSSSSSNIMLWLDKQEKSSVIYVSFGTTTTFKEEQVEQIAIGLEKSNQKFIWVLRDADQKGEIFHGNEVKRHDLSNGFEERVKEMGLVVRDWAPQLEILNHPSIGGFMSHCGWNSCLESISFGVPIATWPLQYDQPINSVFITQVLKVGLVVKDWSQGDELVKASDIEIVVRKLMETKEGDDMRDRAMVYKKAIHSSMEEGGASSMEINSFIAHITR